MWRVEDVLKDLKEEGVYGNCSEKEESSGLPPGFRFHPTDEELITFYLASKVFNTTTTTTNINNNNNTTTNLFLSNSDVQIVEVDLTRCEPWDLPERAKMGEREWYLFSLRDRKYPSGLRTNRATETGYWKATGKDRQVYAGGITTAAGGAGGVLIGMKKTLVFYQGRAPRGVKTSWVMHEYRLDGHFSSFRLSSKEEWVICRICHKNAEKKLSPLIIHPPPSPPPPPPPPRRPLSPFLSSLPPLADLPSSSSTQEVTDAPSQHRNYANSHDLLHSLLLNPLPNFSSISGSNTIFPPLTTTTTTTAASIDMSPSSTLFKSFHHPSLCCLSSTTTTTTTANNNNNNNTAAASDVTKQWQPQQQWLNRICPQNEYIIQNQYHHHHHHHNDPVNFNQMMDPQPLPNTYPTTTTTTTISSTAAIGNNNHHDEDGDAAVHLEMSPSVAVAALDWMLNHTNNNNNNHPHPTAAAESWCFQIHP